MNKSSNYIDEQRREYSLYTLQSRAIPHAADGLKAAARRVLWTARDGKKHKSATLAGATMPIHPHAAPESTINTLAADFGNNIPLLHGDGAFGTLLEPMAFGASRYTSVTVSDFSKDVLFKDIEIIPMIENYDSSLMEPKHFLPLIPIALLNPSEGIAVGFASTILPRDLADIITAQINHIEGKRIKPILPYFAPINNRASSVTETDTGLAYTFVGSYKELDKTSIHITQLPYDCVHEKFINGLEKLIEVGTVISYDDNSKDVIDVTIKFKRGYLSDTDRETLLKTLGLVARYNENLNVINFDGNTVWNPDPITLIKTFTDWRLEWYKTRYERLRDLIKEDLQRYKDILLAIKKNVGSTARTVKSRNEFKLYLTEIGVVDTDYIADLPIYRFTEEERKKVEEKLDAANAQLGEYVKLLKSEPERRKIYVKELEEIVKKYCRGTKK